MASSSTLLMEMIRSECARRLPSATLEKLAWLLFGRGGEVLERMALHRRTGRLRPFNLHYSQTLIENGLRDGAACRLIRALCGAIRR